MNIETALKKFQRPGTGDDELSDITCDTPEDMQVLSELAEILDLVKSCKVKLSTVDTETDDEFGKLAKTAQEVGLRKPNPRAADGSKKSTSSEILFLNQLTEKLKPFHNEMEEFIYNITKSTYSYIEHTDKFPKQKPKYIKNAHDILKLFKEAERDNVDTKYNIYKHPPIMNIMHTLYYKFYPQDKLLSSLSSFYLGSRMDRIKELMDLPSTSKNEKKLFIINCESFFEELKIKDQENIKNVLNHRYLLDKYNVWMYTRLIANEYGAILDIYRDYNSFKSVDKLMRKGRWRALGYVSPKRDVPVDGFDLVTRSDLENNGLQFLSPFIPISGDQYQTWYKLGERPNALSDPVVKFGTSFNIDPGPAVFSVTTLAINLQRQSYSLTGDDLINYIKVLAKEPGSIFYNNAPPSWPHHTKKTRLTANSAKIEMGTPVNVGVFPDRVGNVIENHRNIVRRKDILKYKKL